MNLLKKWRKHQSGDREEGLVKRQGDGHGLSRLDDAFDRVFDRAWNDFHLGLGLRPQLAEWPAIDMAEDDKAMTLRVDVPGMDPKDLQVELTGGTLTIRGSRQDEWSDNEQGVYRRERRYGSFVRSVPLPAYIDADKLEARYDKGTLTLTAPKIPGHGPRRVRVTA